MTKEKVEEIMKTIIPMSFEITVYKPFPTKGPGEISGSMAVNVRVISIESLRTVLELSGHR